MEVSTPLGSTRGDTLVVFGKNHTVCGHSAIIRENCKALAPFLNEPLPPAEIKSRHKNPGRTLIYRIDMLFEDGKYSLVPKSVKQGLTDPIDSDNDGVVDESLLQALVGMFGLWYNNPPRYGNSIAEILGRGLFICKAGEILGASQAAFEGFEKALINCKEPVWPFIAKYPVEWLILAYNIQSRAIFKEALIHTIGKWLLLQPSQRERAGSIQALQELISLRLIHVLQEKKRIEDLIIGYYPEILRKMSREDNTPANPPGRTSHGAHVFEWMALNCFRVWVGQMTSKDVGRRAVDGGHALYTLMAKGEQHYLKRHELNDFFEMIPTSDKAKKIMFNALDLIKDGVKLIVAPLVNQRAQFNEVPYLTSYEVEEDDYVWLHPVKKEFNTYVKEWMETFPNFELCRTPAEIEVVESTVEDLLGDSYTSPET